MTDSNDDIIILHFLMAIMSPPQYILQMYSISAFALNLYVWYSFKGSKSEGLNNFYLKRATSPPPLF